MRPSKKDYYLGIAKAVAARSTCLRRQYGAVVVKNDRIVATGYNGSPRGAENCCDRGTCKREAMGVAHGERYELCESVHAEQNALLQCDAANAEGATLYLYGLENGKVIDTEPCMMCARVIRNAGIGEVIASKAHPEKKVVYSKKPMIPAVLDEAFIDGYAKDYSINIDGTITSYKKDTPRELSHCVSKLPHQPGYHTVLLTDGGGCTRRWAVSTLLMDAFGPAYNQAVHRRAVGYLDGDPENLDIDNLYWLPKSRQVSSENPRPRNHPVQALNDNKEVVAEYDTIAEASKATGASNIAQALRLGIRSGKYYWQDKKEDSANPE